MGFKADAQGVHKPGPFKQSNKAHKGEKKRIKKKDKGRQDVKAITCARKHDFNKKERRNRAKQLQRVKREEIVMKKRGLENANSMPILVAILSLSESQNPILFLNDLKTCSDDLQVTSSKNFGYCHINSPRFKQRFTFMVPQQTDWHSVMDAIKVADVLVILHSRETLTDDAETLLSVILAHALPTTIHVVQGLDDLNPKKKAEYKKKVMKAIETRFPDDKLYQADSKAEFQLLLRQLSSLKLRSIKFRDNRPHLLAEEVEYHVNNDTEGLGTLKVSGYVCGKAINVNGLVHIPGWGDFQMCAIDYHEDPYILKNVNAKAKAQKLETEEMNVESVICSDKVDPALQESLQSEIVPDPMEGEQTWPTLEELEEAAKQGKKKLKKVADGTSDYQASWIIDSEGSEDSDSENEEDLEPIEEDHEDIEDSISQTSNNMECENDGEGSILDDNIDNYDKNIDMDEEREMLVRFKKEKMNEQFPDEEDTPLDINARIKYQKYRGLENFKRSPWDPMENLPLDYARIYRFENFKQTKKKALNTEKEGAKPGSYVTLHIVNIPQSLYDNVTDSNAPLVVYGLLAHEQKMSVMNVCIRKHSSCKTTIMSKDNLIFHIGFRRFTCKPIFSEHRTGNKFKYERFLQADATVVASFYAPVTFPPASAVVFRQKHNGTHELVATGSVLDVNPNRVVVKRVVLSGHPLRIYTRSAVVRYMFFNRDDIAWFKCVELHTKYGLKGHIKEALGSHGHMRCIFNEQLKSVDTVLMSLYKRVFPKWTYDPYVPTQMKECESSNMESIM